MEEGKEFRSISANRFAVTLTKLLFFLFPIFFFTQKGWTNSISFLLFLVACFYIFRFPRKFLFCRTTRVWVYVLLLALPFFAEFVVQILRMSIQASQLDGPSRFLMAATVLIFTSKIEDGNFYKYFVSGAVVSIFVTAGYLFIFYLSPYRSIQLISNWGGRWSTSFVDPLTLPVFLSVFLGLCFSTTFCSKTYSFVGKALKFLALALVVFITLRTLSRSAWLPILAMCLMFLYFHSKGSSLRFIIYSLLLFSVTLIFGFANDVISSRTQEVFLGFRNFLSGEGVDSTSIRLQLVLLDAYLIFKNPFLGWPDGVLPPLAVVRETIPSISDLTYSMKMLAGSHMELLAQLVRNGVVFGGLKFFCIFLCPLILFINQARRFPDMYPSSRVQAPIYFSVCLLFSGLTLQILNLKMTSTFIAFGLTVFFSNVMFEKKR